MVDLPQSSSPVSLPFSRCRSVGSGRSKTSNDVAGPAAASRPSSPDIWGIQLVSRAYRDVPFAPVDPWKPSLMYSIRHIHPDTASPGGTPTPSSPHQTFSRNQSPIPTAHLGDGSKTFEDFLDYPFSPNDPRLSTTKPLRVPSKSRTWSHNISGYTHTTGRQFEGSYSSFDGHHDRKLSRGSRYSWPYPSPEVAVRSPTYDHSDLSPWQRDHFDRLSAQKTRNGISRDTRDWPSPSPGLYNVPHTLRAPARAFHSRQTSGSQTIAEGPGPLPATASPEPSYIVQSHHENHDGTTVMISSNRHYLRPPPKLDRPPGPRSRAANPPQNIPSRVPSKSSHSKSTSRKEAAPQSFAMRTYIFAFLLDTLPRQIYLYFLLGLPYMYFSRVAYIFEAAELSLPRIKQGVIEYARQGQGQSSGMSHNWRFGPPAPSAAYLDLQKTWELFVESLMREWRTLNIISVLLLSAILAILQIESAINDPVTVYAALLSMMCALMSLLYGCMYIIRFGSMRKVSKAAMWAAEAQRSTTCILWNVWVFLSMPAAWLAWSMVMYLVCIMSLVWRIGAEKTWTLTPNQALFPRTTITAVLGLGVIYFGLILNTLRRYGHMMDRAWQKLATGWIKSKGSAVQLRSTQSRHEGFRRGPSSLRSSLRPSPKLSGSSSEKSTTHEPL